MAFGRIERTLIGVELRNQPGDLGLVCRLERDGPILTITIDREDLVRVMMGAETLDQQVKSGKAKLAGKRELLRQLRPLFVTFDPGFELMPGAKAAPAQ